MFDAHCHLDLLPPNVQLDQALTDARAAGVQGWLVAGVDPDEYPTQRRLKTDHPRVITAIGLHPWAVSARARGAVAEALESMADLLQRAATGEIAAVGETGLDWIHGRTDDARRRQRDAFATQLRLAIDLDLPVVLHVVRAHEAALALLSDVGTPRAGGMIHGFTGSLELARRYVDLGLYVSFGTALTRGPARRRDSAARGLPQERILVETDAPDQVAEPHRGRARAAGLPAVGLPVHLVEVVGALARLRGEDPADTARYTAMNARTLFQLEPDDGER